MTRDDRCGRRRVLSLAGAVGAAALAGCAGPGEENETDEPTSGITTDPNTSESGDSGHGHQPAEEDDEPGMAQEDQENATPDEDGAPGVKNETADYDNETTDGGGDGEEADDEGTND